MGFTPTQAALNHMRIAVDAASGLAAIRIVDGADASRVFQTSFTLPGYTPGVTQFGLQSNGGGAGRFDNLAITVAAVPEPAGTALLLAGLGLLAAWRMRQAGQGRAEPA